MLKEKNHRFNGRYEELTGALKHTCPEVDDEERCDGADTIADTLCAACARAVDAKRAGRSALFGDGEVDDGLAAVAADARGWRALK